MCCIWNISKEVPLNKFYYKSFLDVFQHNKMGELLISLTVAMLLSLSINQLNAEIIAKVAASFNIFCTITGIIFVLSVLAGISSLEEVDFKKRIQSIILGVRKTGDFFIHLRVPLIFSFTLQFIAIIKQDNPSLIQLSNMMLSVGLICILDLYIARMLTLIDYRSRSTL